MERDWWDADDFYLAPHQAAVLIYRGRSAAIALRASCASSHRPGGVLPPRGQVLRLHDADDADDAGEPILSFVITSGGIASVRFHRPLLLERGLVLSIPTGVARPEEYVHLTGSVAVERES